MMNYELGMHCTGFEFSYCCVLPPYNSILAQVVKTQQGILGANAFPRLLQGDPNVGRDFLGRPTVLRDTELDSQGHFKKYVLRYWHDAQPRNDGRGALQTSTLISHVEGNSMLMWNTQFDAAATDSGNKLIYGNYGSTVAAVPPPAANAHQASSPKNNVLQGNGSFADPEDNYANAWLNHLYIYANLEGSNPTANISAEKDKIRLGLRNQNASTAFATVLPQNSGPAFHPMGPGSTPGLNNILTFSGDTGTVVFTQMKVLENLPVMLTSPRIWEALGLPLDPFEDTINFFGDPGKITEESVRPYVQMKAQMHNYDPSQPGGIGTAVLQNGKPVIGMGDAPIDIPNCERCHSLPASVASPNNANQGLGVSGTDVYRPYTAAKVQLELDFWNAYYSIDTVAGDSDWYSRLKAAAISILSIHDNEHRTDFTLNYPQTSGSPPQLTRLGHESVLCQRCHADNVIAVVKSASTSRGLIPPLTEALHNNHKDLPFDDSKGRNGACQGCHPAHRSDGDLSNYPITTLGLNNFANADNRDAAGGCFVGRDVHSNPGRGADLGGKIHLNAIGQWLKTNVANDTGHDKGIWCTNCHSQLSQEVWRNENMVDLIRGVPGKQADGTTAAVNIRALPTLAAIASAVGVTESQAIAWLDPKHSNDDTYAAWNDAIDYADANVATIEILAGGSPKVTTDVDGDPSVRILDFCTTPDCVAAAQTKLNSEGNGSTAVPVPFQAADDARDHWLAPGEPHCADCHKAPYTEQSGNINAFPPFNYPRKASLFRYSRGHQDITCQGCHESTHGLYPVTPNIDTTTYAQAAGMNPDGKHGPLKCGACHISNSKGVALATNNITYNGTKIATDFDSAVSWAHTFTDEADARKDVCVSCHRNRAADVSDKNAGWLLHSALGFVARNAMDKVETSQLGHVAGDPASGDPLQGVCKSCHLLKVNFSNKVACNNNIWKQHVPFGAVSQSVWEYVSKQKTGSSCGY
jgi:mono/diheme cytochrome c family protein